MEDMKNLIIQSLETKGVLGQLRAKLRSAVFKIVDEQDQQFNMGCGLKWENPTLYKILETKIGTLLAEVIREFMEYFRMDYSLSIFIPECGISPERLKKDEIFGKMGLFNNSPANEQFLSKMQLPLLYYIMYFFIQNLKENPNKVIESIQNAQDDIEKKSDDIIELNIIEFLKNNGEEEQRDIPSSNRVDIPNNNINNNNNNVNNNVNNNEKNNNNNLNKNNSNEIENLPLQQKQKKSYEYDDINQQRRGLSLDNDEDENNNNLIKKKDSGKKEEEIAEEIAEDIDDSMQGGSGNKASSSQNNNSQTVSQSLGYDATVESGQLDNYNYVEQVEKK
jgi:FGFR1 oncogene partner